MATNVVPDADTEFGTRVRRRLAEATVGWLTTVGRDGTPQPNPVWFLWDGEDSLLVYNRPDANRLTHVKDRPRVSLNLDGNGAGGDVIVVTGTAAVVEDVPPAHHNPDYLAKYAEGAARVSGNVESFGDSYPVALRITITKVRGF